MQCEICLWVSGPAEIHPLVLQIFSLAANLATVAGVLVASIVGWKAYTNWKNQLRGRVQYELARRLLKKVYDYELAVRVFDGSNKELKRKIVKMLGISDKVGGEGPNKNAILPADELVLDPDVFSKLLEGVSPSGGIIYLGAEMAELKDTGKLIQDAVSDLKVDLTETQLELDNLTFSLLIQITSHGAVFSGAYDRLLGIWGFVVAAYGEGEPYSDIDNEFLHEMWEAYSDLFGNTQEDDITPWIKQFEDRLDEYLLRK